MLVPLGPVAVFGSTTFRSPSRSPVGDTASALAAGNPVIIKAHGLHAATSQCVFDIMAAAARAAGALTERWASCMVRTLARRWSAGRDFGPWASPVLSAARALMGVIESPRPDPVLRRTERQPRGDRDPAAAETRAADIGTACAASFSTSAGQLCTASQGCCSMPRGLPMGTPRSSRH